MSVWGLSIWESSRLFIQSYKYITLNTNISILALFSSIRAYLYTWVVVSCSNSNTNAVTRAFSLAHILSFSDSIASLSASTPRWAWPSTSFILSCSRRRMNSYCKNKLSQRCWDSSREALTCCKLIWRQPSFSLISITPDSLSVRVSPPRPISIIYYYVYIYLSKFTVV